MNCNILLSTARALFASTLIMALAACGPGSGSNSGNGSGGGGGGGAATTGSFAAPTGVATTPGNGQATVTWTAVTGAVSYNVYYATTTGVTPATGTKTPAASTTTTLTGLVNGVTYYLVVTAVDSTGAESPASLQVNVTPMDPMVPQNASATSTPLNWGVTIAWQDWSGGAANTFNVYRSTMPGVAIVPANRISVGIIMYGAGTPSSDSTVDTNVTKGVTYYYRVTSVSLAGAESAGSNEASATY